MNQKRVIIFGSNGMLGRYMKKYLENFYDVLSINRNIYDIENNDVKQLLEILRSISNENDIVVNCCGLIPQRKERDKQKYILVNSLFPHQLKNICEDLKLTLIHITTDCVFSGKKGNYNENDLHDGVDFYSKSKSLGEPDDVCIVRTSIIGEELNNKKSLLEWVISNRNKEIDGYTHVWNGLTCLELSKVIYQIIKNNIFWKGVRHIHSPNSKTKYELLNIINSIYNLNITINKVEKKRDMSLSTIYKDNLFSFNISDIDKQIKELKNFNIKNNKDTF